MRGKVRISTLIMRRGARMKKLRLAILISLLIVCIFYIKSIVSFVSCLFFDKCYGMRERCVRDGCYVIVDESRLSINSHVTTYFFNSNLFPFPFINKNYVFFDTDTFFCVIRNGGDSFYLVTRIAPEMNNISSKVHIINVDRYNLPCEPDTR